MKRKIIAVIVSVVLLVGVLSLTCGAVVVSVAPSANQTLGWFVPFIKARMTATVQYLAPTGDVEIATTENAVESFGSFAKLGDADYSYTQYVGTKYGNIVYRVPRQSVVGNISWYPTLGSVDIGGQYEQASMMYEFSNYGISESFGNAYYVDSGYTINSNVVAMAEYTADYIGFNEFGRSFEWSVSGVCPFDTFVNLSIPENPEYTIILCKSYRVNAWLKNPANGDIWGGNTTRPIYVELGGDYVINSYDSVGYGVSEMAEDIATLMENQAQVEDFTFGEYLTTAVGGFLSADLFGSVSLGDILLLAVGITLVVLFLKFFAGG